MNRHISKQELKRADQLTAAGRNAFEYILKNQKMVLSVALVLLLAGAGYVAWDKVNYSKEVTVQEDFYSIEKSYLKTKEAFDKAEAEQKDKALKEASKKDPTKKKALEDTQEASTPSLTPPSGDLNKDYGTVVTGWNKLIDAHPGSKAAAMAALELSQLYLKYKAPKEALSVLSKVKNQQNSDHFLGAMVFHSYAKLLADQGQCQDAIGIWEGLEKKKKLEFLAEQSQMGRALCLESLGQTEKAEAVFKDLAVEGNNSPMTPSKAAAPPKGKSQTQKTAEKYLRYMKLKKSMATTGTTPS